MTPSVAVVIVTYNGQDVIDRCISTLIESTDLLSQIIVVDNQSNDNTISILNRYKEDIQLHILDDNLGFGRANNIGIEMALDQESDYVLLLNQDVYFPSNDLSIFLKGALQSTNQKIGIFSPIHISGEKGKLDYNFKTFLFKNNPSDLVDAYLLNQADQSNSYEVDFVNAAIWLLPKKTLEIVGGFDPLFFHYGEDRNFANRVHYHGLSTHVIPNSYAIHDRKQEDSKYKKEHLAQFLFLVEATDQNISYSTAEKWARIIYRNYLHIYRERGLRKFVFKCMIDITFALQKGSPARKIRKSYTSNHTYRYLTVSVDTSPT